MKDIERKLRQHNDGAITCHELTSELIEAANDHDPDTISLRLSLQQLRQVKLRVDEHHGKEDALRSFRMGAFTGPINDDLSRYKAGLAKWKAFFQ